MATVNLINVNKVYEETTILDAINLNIERGEFVAVVGPSGSGKTTLLRLVAGLESISDGQILINNQCVNAIAPHRRDMAMVFQNYALYPHMSVFDNMAYGLKMRKVKRHEIEARVKEVAQLLQLSPYLQRKPKALSGGQRQRVAMGRAIVRSPAVFLFDEPLSNLDAALRNEMRHEIKKLHRQLQTTCIYVTHDQTEAMTLADKIVVLHQGKIEQIGAPNTLYQKPASLFVARFMGHYPMNCLPANINPIEKTITLFNQIILPLPSYLYSYEAKEVIVGVRPEHVYPTNAMENSFNMHVEFIDDTGADKLLQGSILEEKIPLCVRVFDEVLLSSHSLRMAVDLDKASLFCKKTGQRLGGFHDKA